MSRTSATRSPLRRFRQTQLLAHFEILESLQLAVPTGLVVLILSVLIGGDVVQSARVAALLCGNIIAADIWLTVLQKDRRALVGELRSVALLVGTVAPALLSAVFSYFGQSWISGLILFPAGALLALWISKTSLIWSSDLKFQVQPQRSDCSYFVWSTLGVAIVIFAWHVAALIFIGLFILLNVNSLRPKSKPVAIRSFVVKLICSAGICVAVSNVFGFQPIRWSWSDADLLWDESMAWASQRHFLVENPFYVGEPFHIYQLGNLWAGDYSRVLSLGTFEFLSGSGIVIGLLVVLFVAQDLYSIFSNEQSWFFPIVLVLCAQASFPDDWVLVEALRVPNLLGLGWALGGMLLYVLWIRTNKKVLVGLFVATAIAVALCKTPYSINLALLVAWHHYFSRDFQVSRSKKFLSWLIAGFCFLVMAISMQFLSGPRNSLEFSASWWSTIIILNLILFRSLGGLIGFSRVAHLRTINRAILLSTWSIGVLLFVTMTTNNGAFHLLSMQFALTSIPVATSISNWESTEFRRLIWQFCAPAFLLGLAMGIGYWVVRIPVLLRGGKMAFLLEGYLPLIFLGLVLCICGLIVIAARGFRSSSKWLVLVIVSINAGLYIGHGFRQSIESVLHGVSMKQYSLREDERYQVGNWLRENTSNGSIIASNLVCLAELGEISNPSSDGDCMRRNRESWLSAVSQRKQYFEAPDWSQIGEDLTGDQRNRLQVITSLVDSEFEANIVTLWHQRVDYFVLDKSNSSGLEFEHRVSCASQGFESVKFAIYDIRSCHLKSSDQVSDSQLSLESNE